MSAEQVDEVVSRASEAVRERYDDTVAELRRGYDRLRRELEDVSRRADRSVRRHPYETVAITVAVGFLAGFLVGFLARPRHD